MIAIRRAVLQEIYNDPEWSKRFERAKTVNELTEVLEGYCREKGKKIARIGI